MNNRGTWDSSPVSETKKENEMSKSRIGPEAKIITLFNSLSDDSKRIVLDVIKAQASAPRKASTKKQASAPAQKETTPFDTDAKCGICGHTADHSDHDRNYIKSHDFEGPKSAKKKRKESGDVTEPHKTSGVAVGGLNENPSPVSEMVTN